MASLKDVESVADDLSNLVEQLRKELRDNASFDKLVQLADEISEHADQAAGTFSTVNEALMGRLNEIKGDSRSGGSSSGSSSSSSRARART
jgi:ABC-type transporter Mla subunit MlaD